MKLSYARCPRCKINFSQDFACCALCLGPLEPAGQFTSESHGQTWVVVGKTGSLTEAEILVGALVASGIRAVSETRGVAMYPAPEGGLSVYLIRVPISELADALELKALAERGELILKDEEVKRET